MALALSLIAVGGVLYLVQEVFRRAGPWAAWGFFLVLPLLLTPYWIGLGQAGVYRGTGVFPWVKLTSLLFAANWLTALRYTALGDSRWARGGMFLLLPLNMLEAITRDATGGHVAHYLIAAMGMLLIIAVPHPLRAIQVDRTGPHRDLVYVGMTRPWIAGYTLRNWAFVYLNFPEIAGHQLAVLASAFVVGMAAPERWLQVRGFTLATDLLVLPTFPGVVIPFTDTSYWSAPDREMVAAGVCLAIGVLYTACHFVQPGHRAAEVVAAELGARGTSSREAEETR